MDGGYVPTLQEVGVHLHPVGGVAFEGQREKVSEVRVDIRRLGAEQRIQLFLETVPCLVLRRRERNAEHRAHEVENKVVRDAAAVGNATALDPDRSVGLGWRRRR